jgi:hypothetical protein
MHGPGNSPVRVLRQFPAHLSLFRTLGLAARARQGQLTAAQNGAVEIP